MTKQMIDPPDPKTDPDDDYDPMDNYDPEDNFDPIDPLEQQSREYGYQDPQYDYGGE